LVRSAARYDKAMANDSSDWATARGDKWRAQLSGMEAMLRPVDAPLIRDLRLDARCRVAEIGCGGGATAREILRRAPAGSIVHGFDISPGLVELARGRTLPDEHNLVFEVADVAMAAPDNAYDRLVSRFSVMFFDDPRAAFANLVRWLVPGGRFAFAVWGPLPDNPWMTSVREVASGLVELPAIDPEAPGPFRYAEAGNLLALLEHAGFGDLHVRDWGGPLSIGGGLSPAEAAHFAIRAFSSFGELLARAGDEALDNARRALTARFSRHQADGVVQMSARVHIVTGTRP
jgi:SAM-dependent methyltransferase